MSYRSARRGKTKRYLHLVNLLHLPYYCVDVIPDLIGNPYIANWIPASAGMTFVGRGEGVRKYYITKSLNNK